MPAGLGKFSQLTSLALGLGFFHQEIELARGRVGFHLAVPVIIRRGVELGEQLRPFLRRQMIDRLLDFLNRAHSERLPFNILFVKRTTTPP